jgi:hypothetical protein
MIEKVMNIDTIQAFLSTTFETKKVRVREVEGGILVEPMAEMIHDEEYNRPLLGIAANDKVSEERKEYSCPFLGIGKDLNLTVDKFLEMKREEIELEYEKERRLFS